MGGCRVSTLGTHVLGVISIVSGVGVRVVRFRVQILQFQVFRVRPCGPRRGPLPRGSKMFPGESYARSPFQGLGFEVYAQSGDTTRCKVTLVSLGIQARVKSLRSLSPESAHCEMPGQNAPLTN